MARDGWYGVVLMLGLTAAGCASEAEPDAYGNVEATEVIVGAEAGGQLVSFTADEGASLNAGAVVGTIEATQLMLERQNADAQRAAAAARVGEIGQQIDVLQAQRDAASAQRDVLIAQRDVARRTYDRTQRLFAQQAATAQQRDQAEREVRTLSEQVTAQEAQIRAHAQQIDVGRAQQRTAQQQVAAAEAQVRQISDRIDRTEIENPVGGTVLATYAARGELVQPGQPLYKIADLDPVEIRAYVTETQLAALQLGQRATVTVDVAPEERRTVAGTVSWISAEAEFTPTPIQTREERADLVYAVKIRVPNPEGLLKIGMPADVTFSPSTTPDDTQ